MNFSIQSNGSERISNNFGEYFNQQIPIREATTGYHQPIPESLLKQNFFPNEAVINIPLPEENKQMEVNVRAVKRKRDDGCPILAKPAPVSPNKRARLSDRDAYFVDIFKPMMFQPPIRTGFPAAPSTMKLPYWPALVTVRPVRCGQFDVEMKDINPIPPNHPTRKMLHIKRRCFTSSIGGKVEMTKVTPMEVDTIVGSSKNWRKNRNRRKNKKDRANRIRELAIDDLLFVRACTIKI